MPRACRPSSIGSRRAARSRARRPATTPITEAEVNSYLRYELGDRIPAGVTDPWVSILENGRLSGKATVDLARVGQSRKSSGMLDPFNLLTGALPLTVNGVLQTKNGVGTFALESASISGVPVPGLDAPGNRELLLEVGVGAQTASSHRQAVRASRRHPRDPARPRAGHRRSVDLGSRFRFGSRFDQDPEPRNLDPRVHRLPPDSTSVSERRRAEASRRSSARRPRRPSKIFSTDFRFATKTADTCSRSRR